ncbi:type II toxin-antitoxin system prevent-host-death family antitoxin [Candidatus Bathyarchaeota archaeon]|nr:type II toxin-antitoxin system prevent-host-death family antitoxin [Candidatus Bathyarchaeota archaeon]
MQVYTYSEARQNLSSVLDRAESTGKVIIRRKDGRTFALVPERTRRSPLDVPSIQATIPTEELVEIVRKERGRTRGWRQRPYR